jgi:hypothetical protein
MTKLILEPYLRQLTRWPSAGRHILAQHDAQSVIVYQAYRPSIGEYAVSHGEFGGEWSFQRMSWIKPGFLWMMYRSGWGEKPDQERVLAIRLQRAGFEAILAACVPSSFDKSRWPDEAAWRQALADSEVRLQWDPDHDPAGRPLDRRALQLGLRGETLRRYAREWILAIDDVTALVAEQRAHARERGYPNLMLPSETVYRVTDPTIRAALHVDA